MHPILIAAGDTRTLLRAARHLQWRLERPSQLPSSDLTDSMRQLLQRQAQLQRCWRLLTSAEERCWTLAAGRLREGFCREIGSLRDQAASLAWDAANPVRKEPALPSGAMLSMLLGELKQLQNEFESVAFDLKGHVIIAETEPIVLEELALGAFRVELHIDRLSTHADVSAFKCVAITPNPASSSDDITHPHVKAEALCAGDATVPIGLALRQGRICDAFCLVRSVLNEYNGGSPYVAIEDWEGVRCADCDCLTVRDELYYCESCCNDICGDCNGRCDLCDGSRCRGCLETDPATRNSCCSNCCHTCSDCGCTVDAERFIPETHLCPECHQRQQDEQTEEINDEDSKTLDPSEAATIA